MGIATRNAPASVGYFNPAKPRPVRSVYPTRDDVEAWVSQLEVRALALLEDKADGEPLVAYLWRRVGWVPKCEGCGALAGGEFGHRPMCRVFQEWRYRFDNWWFGRPRFTGAHAVAYPEEWDPEDVPF